MQHGLVINIRQTSAHRFEPEILQSMGAQLYRVGANQRYQCAVFFQYRNLADPRCAALDADARTVPRWGRGCGEDQSQYRHSSVVHGSDGAGSGVRGR